MAGQIHFLPQRRAATFSLEEAKLWGAGPTQLCTLDEWCVCAQESKTYKPRSTNIGFIIKQGGRHVSWEADARNIAYDGMQRRNKRLISISGQKAELTQRPGRMDAALRSICAYLSPPLPQQQDGFWCSSRPTSLCVLLNEPPNEWWSLSCVLDLQKAAISEYFMLKPHVLLTKGSSARMTQNNWYIVSLYRICKQTLLARSKVKNNYFLAVRIKFPAILLTFIAIGSTEIQENFSS